MKVKELIEELKQYDDDLEVRTCDEWYSIIDQVSRETEGTYSWVTIDINVGDFDDQ